jgi:hypothetical protein
MISGPKVELHCYQDGIPDPEMDREIRIKAPDFRVRWGDLRCSHGGRLQRPRRVGVCVSH